MRHLSWSPLLLWASLHLACAPGTPHVEEAPLASHRDALTVENGVSMNGVSMNGVSMNGSQLGALLTSVNFSPVLMGGKAYDSVWLEGTLLKAAKGSVTYAGAELVQAEFRGNVEDGSTVRLRLRGVSAAPAPNSDLQLYDFEYRGADNLWRPLCTDAAGSRTHAMPVAGVWDYRQGVQGGGDWAQDAARFTLACQSSVITKCVLFGYRPWGSHNGTALRPFHQACTRLVRADYCGDGTSYTKDGNLINLYDTLGIQQDTEDWVFEAEWDEKGARCFNLLNRSNSSVHCYDERVDSRCGQNTSFSRGVLMMNETPSAGLHK
jgi:hypothetical protein